MKIDARGKDAVLEILAERARSYTPEWNMNTADPDIASALAVACADMFAGTIRKINGLPLKNEIAFFNAINSSLLPASPSEGYVSFSLSADDVGNAEVVKGTVLSAYANDDGDTMHFETKDDILVSPARIEAAFCVDDSEDHIGRFEELCENGGALFGTGNTNLQSHVMTLGHPFAFNVRTEAEIRLMFCRKGGIPVNRDYVNALSDADACMIEYYAGEETGYLPFSGITERNGALLLYKSDKLPPVSADENGFGIRFTVKDMARFDGFSFSYIAALPSAKSIEVDCVTDGNIEFDRAGFYPFGERFQLFNEVYFGCGEVLDKRGAQITLSFDMNLDTVPIENQPDFDINWKWIAKRGDFREPKSYKITISEVIWEYYNGYGWARLFSDRSYCDIFNCPQDVTSCFRSMTFRCPEDMTEVFVGARSDCYIRARIIRAENLYKLRGDYLSPYLRNIALEYYYTEAGCRLNKISADNCLEQKTYDPLDQSVYDGFVPFCCAGADHRSMYLGFQVQPDTGPVRILWNVDEEVSSDSAVLGWEYLTERGWKPMNVIDETESFTKAGLTIFLDNPGFVKKRIFGEELYWIRIYDRADRYRTEKDKLPVIKSIHFNSVRAVNIDSHREEFFPMNVYTENAEFTLAAGDILDFELYVNEFSTITDAEAEKLRKEGRVIRVKDSTGMDTHIWVKWKEVSSFLTENNTSRCYTLDRGSGKFSFGNGRKGRIPSVSDNTDIRVRYTTGGGSRTNVETGVISSMERSIGFVSAVTNPKRFFGGRDAETIFEAMKRSSIMLRTQNKAVTSVDIEQLAMYASRSVIKARCISGRDINGEREQGAVTLVVMKDPHSEFSKVRREIEEYLMPRLPSDIVASGKLYIIEPVFITMNVHATVAANELNGIFDLKKSVEECLLDYIGSYRGKPGDTSWNLGMIPNEQQIRSVILRLDKVSRIKSLGVTTYVPTPGGLKETDEEGLRKYRYILPENGHHDISVIIGDM